MANEKETVLRVKDLRISFRTVSGKVQAVRGVNFNLAKGETLAIVGESGSGKSVTNRAIMGILAGNGIVESGEILYDGKDLLKISEYDLHYIRGDKIAMIFQDPLSSLNPIIRIGRQLTEATLLKNKANRKAAKKAHKADLGALKEAMLESTHGDEAKTKDINEKLALYEKVAATFLKLEVPYNRALGALDNAKVDIDDLVFNVENKVNFDCKILVKEFCGFLLGACHDFVLYDKKGVQNLVESLRKTLAVVTKNRKNKNFSPLLEDLKKAHEIVHAACDAPKASLFAYAYCQVTGVALPERDGKDLASFLALRNQKAEEALNDQFVEPFQFDIASGLFHNHNKSLDAMRAAIELIEAKRGIIETHPLDPKSARQVERELADAVEATIDPLELVKDSYSYTFRSALRTALDRYFRGLKINAREERRFAKQQSNYDAKVAQGKTPSWKPVPANVTPVERLIGNISKTLNNIVGVYKDVVAAEEKYNASEMATKVIPHLYGEAARSVDKITKSMARTMAIRSMKEVGIPEPRRRFRQYPFEFSGGMRQRIVIAIAMSANPEILICDEPTTALDVTIQAQILELINKLKAERQLSVIFITHNLGVVANMADKIAVMYAGKIVEYGTYNDIFYEPKHPYTWALLSSMPDLETKERLEAIPGTPPNMIYPPKGDAFAARNKYALNIDFKEEPPFFQLSPTHYAATWLCHPDAPKVERPALVDARIALMKKRYGKEIAAEVKEELKLEPDEAFKDIAVLPEEFAKKGGK